MYKLTTSGVTPSDGDILVSGATGGVGSMAVNILSKIGYSVIAATGKPEAKDILVKMGAKDIVLRKDIDDKSGKALLKGRWAGVIDTVGGNILATALKSTKYGGSVTSCGNVASPELSTTVYPFILRGVSLLGIDSVKCPRKLRLKLWELLSNEWKLDSSNLKFEEISLSGLDAKIEDILKGKLIGRTIVNLDL